MTYFNKVILGKIKQIREDSKHRSSLRSRRLLLVKFCPQKLFTAFIELSTALVLITFLV